MIPAVGQGRALLMCRADDTEMLEMLAPISDEQRVMLLKGTQLPRQLSGGCQVPMDVMVP